MIPVFFYGSFINREVLAELGVTLARYRVAILRDHDILIRPLATVVPRIGFCVYGIVAELPQPDVDRLYGEDWVRAYAPVDLAVETLEGAVEEPRCYVAPPCADPLDATDEYIDRIAGAARGYGFPDSYIERIEQFRP